MAKETPYPEFGAKLTELRKNAGISRQELGDICGVAQSTIVNYEQGKRIPYADTAVKMADYFHISIHDLLCVENPDLAMAHAQSLDMARGLSGKKGVDRMKAVLEDARHLAGGDLSDDQLLEFSLEMTKMAQLAQQKLTERYTNRRYKETVDAKAQKTAENVEALNEQIKDLASKKD